jgi:F5/8 type C domain
MLDNYGMSTVRKRKLDESETTAATSGALDLTRLATVAYSSEDPAHPVEHMFDGRMGPGSSRWAAAQPDTVERIVIEFDRPQSVTRLVYEVEETQHERTQEVHVEVSTDGGQTYRRVFVQEYTFSPRGATFEREDLRLEVHDLTHLRLTVVPNKHGSGVATLTSLSLYA